MFSTFIYNLTLMDEVYIKSWKKVMSEFLYADLKILIALQDAKTFIWKKERKIQLFFSSSINFKNN